MVDTWEAIDLVEPMWESKKKETASEERNVCRLKAAHDIARFDYLFVAGESGGSVSQKGDGYVEGTRRLRKRVSVPKKATSN